MLRSGTASSRVQGAGYTGDLCPRAQGRSCSSGSLLEGRGPWGKPSLEEGAALVLQA